MECVIDTNALVYEMMEDSDLHTVACDALKKVTKRIIPTVVLEELAYVLEQLDVDDAIIRGKLEELLNGETNETLPILPDHMQAAIGILSRHRTSFKRFNDKIVLAAAKETHLPLLTFDKELLAECRKESVNVVP
jgi:predicted nucleic acid-binding protein